MTRHAIAVLLGVTVVLANCGGRVLRDAGVYQAEVDQYDRWATRQAALLRDFVSTTCSCDGPRFADPRCREAADWLLTVEARHVWHREMARFNAGLAKRRPSVEPPPIPPSSCPLPATSNPEVHR